MDTQRVRLNSNKLTAHNKMISIKSEQLAINRMSPRVSILVSIVLLVISSIQTIATPQHLQNDQYLMINSNQQPVQLDPSAEYSTNNELLAAASEQQQQTYNDQQHDSPGHYAFDVAPNMKPPTVRSPPYRQTTQSCPGSNLFENLSPRDTLCGDLNQGKLPLNPLGQSITDQTYPFELIQNKALQFIAKALPVLKLEYETIPKEARHLPPNHMLNPTHHQSPLADSHFQELNQRFALSGLPGSADLMFDPTAGLLKRKRRSINNSKQQQHQASLTLAELTSNATMVVSSAHSQAGRIQTKRSSVAGESNSPHYHLITKEGYRPISPGNNNGQSNTSHLSVNSPTSTFSSAAVVVMPNSNLRDHDQRKSPTSKAAVASNDSALSRSGANNQQISHDHVDSGANRQQTSRAESQVAATTGRNHANQVQVIQGHKVETILPASNRLAGESNAANENKINGQVEARSGAGLAPTSMSNGHQQQQKSENLSSSPAASSSGSSGRQNGNKNSSTSPTTTAATQKHRLNCAGLGSTVTSAVCQTAAALIEGDKPPAWFQLVRQIGNLYAAGSTDSLASWPLLGLLGAGNAGGFNGGHSDAAAAEQTDAKSSAGAKQSPSSSSSAASSIWSILNPLASLLTPSMQKDSGDSHQHNQQTTGIQTKRNDHHKSSLGLTDQLSGSTLAKVALAGWATTALAGLVDYFVPSAFGSAANSFARRKKPFDPNEIFVDTPASLAANLNSASSPLGGGNSFPLQPPPTPCPSVEEYISPTFARNQKGAWKYVVQIPHEGYFTQTIQRTSCVRQKCEFTDGVCHEAPRWVSLLVADIYYPNAVFGSTTQNPASLMANSLNEQQHQSPQTLMPDHMQANLVASSTNSNSQQVALGHQPSGQQQSYGTQAKQQQQQQHLHRPKQIMTQDPLQMTDSFNTYNHNLNGAALLNAAANQLGIDPTNVAQMQQLADMHNHQLTQRNGQLTQSQLTFSPGSNQQQVAESRASHVVASQPTGQARQVYTPAQQSNQFMNGMNRQHIIELAAATLRENPHLTIDDLIKSLQHPNSRRKRDLHPNTNEQNNRFVHHQQQQQQHQQQQYQQQQQQQQLQVQANNQQQFNQIQHRSSPVSAESSSSLNDLGASLSPQQKQVFNPTTPNSIDQLKQQMIAQDQSVGSRQQQQQQLTRQPSPIGTVEGPNQNPDSNSINTGQESNQAASSSASSNVQTECDGHDKIGCYVVRVYYDWFLVNGSCKCWKIGANANGNQQQQGSSSGNSFLRRIFNG